MERFFNSECSHSQYVVVGPFWDFWWIMHSSVCSSAFNFFLLSRASIRNSDLLMVGVAHGWVLGGFGGDAK